MRQLIQRAATTLHVDVDGLAAAATCIGLTVVARAARPDSRLWLAPALAAAPLAAFFRDPRRTANVDESAVLAAADGTVVDVRHITDDRFSCQCVRWLRVAVFLSLFDVHVNRAPVEGQVVSVLREPGGCAAAMRPAADHNAAAYTILKALTGPVVVAQRTGVVARRIVSRVAIGARLERGERVGLIRFGSRADVYLPADAVEVTVDPGERVTAGVSVIARWL